MSPAKVLLYFIRHGLRVSDNPILQHIATHQGEFTHLLPVFVFHARQIEISGLIQDGSESPFPEAKSRIGRFWRCGPHRIRFVTEAVWDMKGSLESIGSGLLIRVGQPGCLGPSFRPLGAYRMKGLPQATMRSSLSMQTTCLSPRG